MTSGGNGQGTDWNLVTQGQFAVGWVFECIKERDADRKIGEMLASYCAKKEDCSIFNPGLLLMYGYLVFVYPKETAIETIEVRDIDTSMFTYDKAMRRDANKGETDTVDGTKRALLRHLRNAITHGGFSIDKDTIHLRDVDKRGETTFEGSVGLAELGKFFDAVFDQMKKQYFTKSSAKKSS